MPKKRNEHDLARKMGKRSQSEFAEELGVDASLVSRALRWGQISMHIKARCLELWGWPIDDWERKL